MNLELLLKIISVFLVIVMIFSFYLFFTFKIDALVFWIIVIICAAAAYWAIPYARKKIKE